MKYTLLDLVQLILSSMDSDEINSINDNQEAQQVANIVKTVFYDLKARSNLPEHYDFFELLASNDATQPTIMYIPDYVDKVDWVKYNRIDLNETDQNFSDVTFVPFYQFLKRMYMNKESDPDVGTFDLERDGDTFTIMYRSNSFPRYYTIFDDHTIIFDSYNNQVDTTLQKEKTLCYGRKTVVFNMTDSFIPDLDDEQFPLLLNEAKSLAWFEMKQQPHQKAEQYAKRQWTHLQGNKKRYEDISDFDQLPNFGRK